MNTTQNNRMNITTDRSPAPLSTNSSQKISPQKGEPGEPTVANQRSKGDPEVRLSETNLTSGETNPPARDPIQPPQSASDLNECDDTPADEIDFTDYLDDESLDAALDLREHLAGRSPLDKLKPKEQQAILRLLDDHEPERVAEVLAEPPPVGLGF